MTPDPARVQEGLVEYIGREVARFGTTQTIRPSHRIKFLWPPHPISYSYHVLASDWAGSAHFEAYGERFDVLVARTPFGVFGRCQAIWLEERGETEEEMLARIRSAAEPLLARQRLIARTLEKSGREAQRLESMEPEAWLRLLYCPDRDVANDAHWQIERYHERGALLPALLVILNDRAHPHRRTAQWCVLDLFEDLPSFLPDEAARPKAVAAISGLLADAEDDYARTVYKAGVVLGGHLAHLGGAEALLQNLHSPSRIGRRSAIHALFHVVEWLPERRDEVLAALSEHLPAESDPRLHDFTEGMIEDVRNGGGDHRLEPTFP
ncbi:MAG: hypothetical protein C4320_06820, partial [Armatimonadota bacterium]